MSLVCHWFWNLQKAINQMEDKVEFEVEWKPYELHPEIPENGYDKKLYMQQNLEIYLEDLYTDNRNW